MQQPTEIDILTVDEDLFTREFEKYMEEAEVRPVRITGGGKPDRILIGIAEYDRLVHRDKESAASGALLHRCDAESK